jgi:DNA modification methylase
MDQSELFLKDQETTDNGPVECLGKTFANDEERRTYFLGLLAEKLKDPEFRKIDGFPIGEDEDILNLSDPPYYTACPNPWISQFIDEWENQKPEKPANYHYHREPFAADVSERKNDPIYRIPSYHTKVPPKAIETYLLHYTEPGDIVIDAFCGTGMTGVACLQLGKDRSKKNYGKRHAILFDLSPAAAFTASVMNNPIMPELSEGEKGELYKFVEKEILPLYETEFNGQKTSFDYAVWSDWGVCPDCGASFRLYDAVVDYKNQKMLPEYPCPECGTTIKSRDQKKAFTSYYDEWLGEIVETAKTSMVLVSNKKGNRAYRNEATEFDMQKADEPSTNPVSRRPEKLKYSHRTHERDNLPKYYGVNYIHQFYTRRNYYALDKLSRIESPRLRASALFCILSILENNAMRRNRFYVDKRRPNGSPVGPLSNSLYIPTIQVETNIGKKVLGIIDECNKRANLWHHNRSVVSNQSATSLTAVKSNAVDFIFTDPPFGGNIDYSELNVLPEWWLKVATNNEKEAVTNNVQNKGVHEYQELMAQCFKEYYRVLKPGRWMVVEFHNSSNTIWTDLAQ